MTQLSKERLAALANIESIECMALPASHAEAAEMARRLLAAEAREPGEYLTHVVDDGVGEYSDRMNFSLPIGTKLYAAPQPVAIANGEYGDAYQGAREDLSIWKRRALESEALARRLEQINDHLVRGAQGESRMGEPVITQPVAVPLDYAQGEQDGREWAAQMAEANHPQTGDWLYDDPLELAKAIRKGPDLPVQPSRGDLQLPQWIPCSEQMPEETGRYWCYVEEQNDLGKSHYQWNCSWNGNRWWVESENGGRVTHWQSLPSAPQEPTK